MESSAKQEAAGWADSRQLRRPRDVRFWIAVTLILAGCAAFGFIAAHVKTDAQLLKQDLQVSAWLHAHGSALITAGLLMVTRTHSTMAIAIMYVLGAYTLWRRKERYWLISFTLAVPGGMLVNNIAKHIFNRARPVWDDPILSLTSASFPSGHTSAATLFYGFIVAYMTCRVKNNNCMHAFFVFIAIVMVALVGFSRIYLGVHYLSDILGAISLSVVWLALCLVAVRAFAKACGANS